MRKTVTVCDLCEKTIEGSYMGLHVETAGDSASVQVCPECCQTKAIGALDGVVARARQDRVARDPAWAQQNQGNPKGYYDCIGGGLKGGR